MLDWYRDLSGAGRATFWACFAGFALDALDVQIYSFVIPTMIGLALLTREQAGIIATSTLVLSAFGGWFAGMLADRFGRVRTLQITVLWFAVFTAACGLTTGFYPLLICRSLQGLGFGGEWAAGSVLMGEVIAARHRGRAVGFVQSSWSVGWGVAAILATIILRVVPPAYAWRALFFVGLLPALVTFAIRRYVPEPAPFVRAHTAGRAPGTLAIFGPHLWWTTLRCSVLALGAQGGYYSITTWLPTFLRTERHITVMGSLSYLMVVIVGSFCGYVFSAYLCDAVGRRLNFLMFAVCSAGVVFLYTHVAISDAVMLVLGFPLGFFASGVFSGMGPTFTELYPTELRGAGQGFCYNAGRGFAAFFPTLVGSASAVLPLGAAIGYFAVIAYGLMAVAALTLPETRGRELATWADMTGGH
ncbi:MFS transporter [Acidisphaera rubrifaciens]|uniref:Major facilitator superfamily transporter n=1 Tax=Acidisphaera rubrifaciens HS-AP3 TaxID=1231350 RepID=A0A0D6PAV1_9PROT|nr:MFS transporter [Acidisphaera rubrifaciens]GAN78323.1 major facilitator superfamily transporter [Acidisphaera rubrifaciens HS-AP3]